MSYRAAAHERVLSCFGEGKTHTWVGVFFPRDHAHVNPQCSAAIGATDYWWSLTLLKKMMQEF